MLPSYRDLLAGCLEDLDQQMGRNQAQSIGLLTKPVCRRADASWPAYRTAGRLGVAGVGLALEAKGRTVLTEREIRSAEGVDGGAQELLEDLGVPVSPGARRG